MASMKTRIAVSGGKYLVTHPTGRITRFVLRLAVRRVSRKLLLLAHAEAIPATRGSRLTTVGGVVVVAGVVVLAVRRSNRNAPVATTFTVPAPPAPAASAVAPEPPDAAVVLGGGDDAIVARVQAKLFDGTPPVGMTVEAHSGVVTLRGRVADEEVEGSLVRGAEAIEGVKAVQSELRPAGVDPGTTAS